MTLELMICTIYPAGIARVAEMNLPRVEGVSYLVSWQQPGDAKIPESISSRKDIRIVRSDSKGLARNRNIALSAAKGDILLIADDDLKYRAEHLREARSVFQKDPELGFALFRCSGVEERVLPEKNMEIGIPLPVKGWYFLEVELAIKREKVQGKAWFDERFGIGSGEFESGEGNTLMYQLVKKLHLKGEYFPITIARHPTELTTGTLKNQSPAIIRSRGVFRQLHYPRSWYLRILMDAWRDKQSGRSGFFRSLKSLTEGGIYSMRHLTGGRIGLLKEELPALEEG